MLCAQVRRRHRQDAGAAREAHPGHLQPVPQQVQAVTQPAAFVCNPPLSPSRSGSGRTRKLALVDRRVQHSLTCKSRFGLSPSPLLVAIALIHPVRRAGDAFLCALGGGFKKGSLVRLAGACTPCTADIAHHTLHVTRYTSHVTRHSHWTCLMSLFSFLVHIHRCCRLGHPRLPNQD